MLLNRIQNQHIVCFKILIFRAVLSSASEQNEEGGTEFSQCPLFPHRQDSNICGLFQHLLSLVNLHGHKLITQSSYFTLRFTLGFTNPMGLNRGIMAHIHHHGITQSTCTALKILCVQPVHLLATPHPTPSNH